MSIPFFVINLPVDFKRKKAIERRLKELDAAYEIVPGIYGDDKKVLERYDEARAIKEHGKPLIFGEKGCAVAHALVYERIAREGIPYSVILEDDILLPDDFLEIVEREIKRNQGKWDWLSFDYRYVGKEFLQHWLHATKTTIKKHPLFLFYALLKAPYIAALSFFEGARNKRALRDKSYAGARRFYRPLYNAGAYVLTLEGAKKLLPFTDPLRLTADQAPNVARWKTDFNLYGYVPLVVKQNTKDYETGAGKTEEEWAKIARK
jgi:GR25 family glycosyltransferase involved in LPS biosynthesis